jgi:hypothetical protein
VIPTLQETAARCGRHCWQEQRLFELLGAAAVAAGHDEVTVVLDRLSLHAAWRAEQWWQRLPVLAGVERSAFVTGPSADAVLPEDGTPQAWAPPPGVLPADDVGALAVTARLLLPRRLVAYRAHAAAASVVAERSVQRTLRLVLADAAADRDDAEDLLCRLLGSPERIQAAAEALSQAEQAGLRTRPCRQDPATD